MQNGTVIGREAGIGAIPIYVREVGKSGVQAAPRTIELHGFGRATVSGDTPAPPAPPPEPVVVQPTHAVEVPVPPRVEVAAAVAVDSTVVRQTPRPKIPVSISRPSMGKLRIRAHDVVVSEGLIIIGFDTSVDDGDVYEPPEALTRDDPLVVTVNGKSYNCIYAQNWTADYRGMFSVVLLRVE